MNIKLFLEAIIKFLLGVLLVGLLLFIPANTINYWNGWLFMGLLFIPMFIAGIVMMIKNPNLLDCIYNYHNCNFFYYAPPTVVVKRGSTTISEITICKESMLSPIEIEIETNGEYTFTKLNNL